MKKIGIITIQSIVNYGNRLQNYAVEQLIKQRNFSVETIRISNPVLWTKIYIKALLSRLSIKTYHNNQGKRTSNFLLFNKKYLNIKVLNSNRVSDYFSNFSYIILGGDQLWAPGNQDYGINGYRFGSMVEPNRRIPFGVSFGSDGLPKEYLLSIKPWIDQLQYLAIREKSGADIIQNITHRRANVLLDPVFGLSIHEWNKICNSFECKVKDYALSFFLNGCSKEVSKEIEKIASKRAIIDINDFNSEYSQVGPDQFIGLIKYSDIVFTDSFHCAAFAIIFNKPFVVFQRNNWDPRQITRLTNMLKIFGLEDRLYNNSNNRKNWYDIDYKTVNIILRKEVKKMEEYLDSTIGRQK